MKDFSKADNPSREPLLFEIRIQGYLDERWIGWIDEAEIIREENGTTLIICQVIDQAALHGILKRIRDLSISLISINRIR